MSDHNQARCLMQAFKKPIVLSLADTATSESYIGLSHRTLLFHRQYAVNLKVCHLLQTQQQSKTITLMVLPRPGFAR